MSQSSMKSIATLLVIIGVGLCATFGAQLTPKTLLVVTQERALAHKLTPKITQSEIEAPTERVKTWWSLSGLPFSGGLLLIIFGSLFARRAESNALNSTESQPNGLASLNAQESLEKMLSVIQSLQELTKTSENSSLGLIKEEIEALQQNTIEPFVDARAQLKQKLGVNQFVEVFGAFSQGERRLNRAWAACVNQHAEEVKLSVDYAQHSIQQALSLIKSE